MRALNDLFLCHSQSLQLRGIGSVNFLDITFHIFIQVHATFCFSSTFAIKLLPELFRFKKFSALLDWIV